MVAFQSEKPEVSDGDKFIKYWEILLFSTSAIIFLNSFAALLSAALTNGSLVSYQVLRSFRLAFILSTTSVLCATVTSLIFQKKGPMTLP